jgi:aspartyl-tRNA(Asn)/glutamyl-tRNA(Gln) amidotransferase subunit C
MAITKKDVAHAADLARIQFSEKEIEGFAGQLDAIVQYIHKLNELNTDNVEPTAHVQDVYNVQREDEAEQKIPDPILFENAPRLKGTLLEVPKVLE